jgi:hypothetical protein
MALRQWICSGLVLMALASTSGCGGVQDPDQPAMGSISVKASRDEDEPNLAPRKTATPQRR